MVVTLQWLRTKYKVHFGFSIVSAPAPLTDMLVANVIALLEIQHGIRLPDRDSIFVCCSNQRYDLDVPWSQVPWQTNEVHVRIRPFKASAFRIKKLVDQLILSIKSDYDCGGAPTHHHPPTQAMIDEIIVACRMRMEQRHAAAVTKGASQRVRHRNITSDVHDLMNDTKVITSSASRPQQQQENNEYALISFPPFGDHTQRVFDAVSERVIGKGLASNSAAVDQLLVEWAWASIRNFIDTDLFMNRAFSAETQVSLRYMTQRLHTFINMWKFMRHTLKTSIQVQRQSTFYTEPTRTIYVLRRIAALYRCVVREGWTCFDARSSYEELTRLACDLYAQFVNPRWVDPMAIGQNKVLQTIMSDALNTVIQQYDQFMYMFDRDGKYQGFVLNSFMNIDMQFVVPFAASSSSFPRQRVIIPQPAPLVLSPGVTGHGHLPDHVNEDAAEDADAADTDLRAMFSPITISSVHLLLNIDRIVQTLGSSMYHMSEETIWRLHDEPVSDGVSELTSVASVLLSSHGQRASRPELATLTDSTFQAFSEILAHSSSSDSDEEDGEILENTPQQQSFIQPIQQPQKTLSVIICVDRNDLLQSSFDEVTRIPQHWLEQRTLDLCVVFSGEDALGHGVVKEWITSVFDEIMQPDRGLFLPVHGESRVMHPNPYGQVAVENHRAWMYFVGCMMSLAVRTRTSIGYHFSDAFLSGLQFRLNGVSRDEYIDLVEQIDPHVHRTCRILTSIYDGAYDARPCGRFSHVSHTAASITEAAAKLRKAEDAVRELNLPGFFAPHPYGDLRDKSKDPEPEVCLMPGLEDVEITPWNSKLFAYLLCRHYMGYSSPVMSSWTRAVREGLMEMTGTSPVVFVRTFPSHSPRTLNMCFGGSLDVDLRFARSKTSYSIRDGVPHEEALQIYDDFWKMMEDLMTPAQRRQVMRFWTAMNSLSRQDVALQIVLDPCAHKEAGRLPTAQTCYNQLVIPVPCLDVTPSSVNVAHVAVTPQHLYNIFVRAISFQDGNLHDD